MEYKAAIPSKMKTQEGITRKKFYRIIEFALLAGYGVAVSIRIGFCFTVALRFLFTCG